MLADMEAKKVTLEKAIESLKDAIAAGALGQPGGIPTGEFLNKSIPVAIKLYLGATKKKQTGPQIAYDRLKKAEVLPRSDNFGNVVMVTLNRLSDVGELLRRQGDLGMCVSDRLLQRDRALRCTQMATQPDWRWG